MTTTYTRKTATTDVYFFDDPSARHRTYLCHGCSLDSGYTLKIVHKNKRRAAATALLHLQEHADAGHRVHGLAFTMLRLEGATATGDDDDA